MAVGWDRGIQVPEYPNTQMPPDGMFSVVRTFAKENAGVGGSWLWEMFSPFALLGRAACCQCFVLR
ncbi:hypothetical protein RRF57_001685 [Xylaria bambusicola]|uniref:Uncharacterized protein n=1 Tax=Xylaria bambusicola TaxID=326684 RepID=A0AAN7URB5_9PEZI